MHFPFKVRALGNINPSSNQLTLPIPQIHPCLTLPEILERIFSYISDRTMTNTVIRVCREWHLLGRHRISRERRWEIGWGDQSKKIKGLINVSDAGRLEWRRDRTPDTLCPWTPSVTLQEIELWGICRSVSMSFGYYPFSTSLKSIKLRGKEPNILRIDDIVLQFPQLEILHIERQVSPSYQTHWFAPFSGLCHHTMLRSLVMRFVCLEENCIPLLLSSLPRLQDVQLIDIVKYHNVNWNYRKLLDNVPSTIQSFHLSMYNEILTDEILEQIIMACPESQNRTFWSYQLTPTVIRILNEQQTFLTTLNVLWLQSTKCTSDGWYYFEEENRVSVTARTLHELLCTASNLRYLRVLKAPYIIQNMDIYRRSTLNPDFSMLHAFYKGQWNVFQPGIWVCRNIKTLHLQVHGHGPSSVNASGLSRILYGYISVVCPRLTELRLESAEMCSLDSHNTSPSYILIDLFAGLCLLSRLRFLQRLFVATQGTKKYEFASLNWLCKSGQTIGYRKQRQAIVNGWQEVLEDEAQLESARLLFLTRCKDGQQEGDGDLPEILGSEHVELMHRLKDLGLLVDVTNQIQQMDSDKYPILPHLELLSLGKIIAGSPEEEICSLSKPSLFEKMRQKIGY